MNARFPVLFSLLSMAALALYAPAAQAQPPQDGPPTITITTPTVQTDFTATGPYLTVAGGMTNSNGLTWSNDRGGLGFVGPTSTTWSVPGIPIAAGPNVITFTASPRVGSTPATAVLHVNGGPFVYSLAEGSTGSFFLTDISIANPNAVAAPVTITFLPENGPPIVRADTIAPTSHKAIHAGDIPGLEATAFSTMVVSESRLPLVVERSMFWDHSYYSGKGAAAVDMPSETWVFAEGVQNSFFNTFVQLENPSAEATTATLTFQLDFGAAPVVQQVPLPPLSRVTIDAGSIPALVGHSFGLSIQAGHPIVAERSTYFESTATQLWKGGHGSPGVTAPSISWFFAEGATGPFRNTYLLLSNPTDQTAHPAIHSSAASLGAAGIEVSLAPHNRLTLPIESLSYGSPPVFPLTAAEFSLRIFSDVPMVAERAMYWIGPPGPWADGTTTFGSTTTGLRWGYAEGRVGGPFNFHTYIRVLNNSDINQSASVKVTFLENDGTTVVREYTVTPPNFRTAEFINIDVNTIPELAGQSFGAIVESTNGVPIATERSMYWDSNGVFWSGGLATAGTRLP